MEQWLDVSGDNIASEPFEPPPDDLASSRLVFFLHYVALPSAADPGRACPVAREAHLPQRLAGVEYEPVD